MDLKSFIQAERGNGVALAEKLRIPLSYLSQMARGIRSITPERAVAIEFETASVVTVESTLPTQQWIRVKDKTWPHPKGRPLHDVGADISEAA
jgi:DNA-binding transcriptional regulator YdaS (Cro superfamily)